MAIAHNMHETAAAKLFFKVYFKKSLLRQDQLFFLKNL